MFFFFFMQKTAYEMRISDWSSDVCSSDLLLVGLLVGALTLGSASPHLFLALGGLDWRPTLLAGSASAAVGALLILGVREGPATRRPARFRPAHVLRYWIDRPVRYANFGYLGHMWELYAMLAWLSVFLAHAYAPAAGAEDRKSGESGKSMSGSLNL